MPYINELHKNKDISNIYVIVYEKDMDNRKKMGWDSTTYNYNTNINYLINPSIDIVIELFNKYNSLNTWGIFSGITSFPFVAKFFKLSLSFNIKRSIITEPPFLYKHPLWQHAIRFAIKDLKYVKYIDKVFLMGDDFISYYRFWSHKWEIIPFMYCTEWKERRITMCDKNSKLKILFVGSLTYRKNVQLIFKALELLSDLEQSEIELGIIGDGETKNILEKMANSTPKVKTSFYGTMPMRSIPDIMIQYDILCLPSLHDGWGAVINEAITLGLYSICSSHCGSKYIIEKSEFLCGAIFTNNSSDSLKKVFSKCIKEKETIREEVNRRIEWAYNNIKGDKVANYFIEHLKK